MKELIEKIHESITKNTPLVCATIFGSMGSSPRTSGAKMLIFEDNSIFGTIGGGRLEAGVLEKSKEVFRDKNNVTMHFNLNGLKETDMICGGEVDVLLEYIDPYDERNIEIYKTCLQAISNNEKATFVTVLKKEDFSVKRYVLTYQNDNNSEGIDKEILSNLKSHIGSRQLKAVTLGDSIYILETISYNDTVYIFGAGHISQKLASLTKMVDFKTVVLDDREEFVNREKFPMIDDIILLKSFDDSYPINIDEDSYIVTVTRGHNCDLKVLKQILKSRAGYIGMMGSKRKRIEICSKLQEYGYEADDLSRIHSPVGIAIKAETPEEIAISIAAELIKERAEK
ncbi:XdhC family aldehyde oxidoreductase maturation factor [Clostridium sp. DJ247]|uniref:XdhC family aldehyde oxidoreductase maturation factor n=1 Tax=Clostridium sp. DJ247 TaxID=2726188 RepID=UPI001623F3E6|nr:XdhC/CoxI family protein [Clostridium sp. DJ247]MBC2582801.1 XdhC/CoxI family protein [Clostridium sp. DJ247]